MNTRALALLSSGAFLAFAGSAIHANHLLANRPQSPDQEHGAIIEFRQKGSTAIAYITRQDQLWQFSIFGVGTALFLLGVKVGAFKKRSEA